jgi:hypothetical protein
MTINKFLTARLAEDAARAGQFHHEDCKSIEFRDFGVCDCGHPARVVREVEAGRAFLARHTPVEFPQPIGRFTAPAYCSWCGSDEYPEPWPCPDLRDRTAVYSDHPDYDPAWSVG